MGWLFRKRVKKTEALKLATKLLDAKSKHMARVGSGGKVTRGDKSPGGLSNSGMTRLFDHSSLRRNVRDAMFDSLVGRGMATRFADTVADTGLRAKFEPDNEVLGLTAEESETWGRRVSKLFNLWMSDKNSSLNGVNNGYQNQWLYSFLQQRDNDMYVRLHYSKDPSLVSPLQVQFLDPDQLSGYGYTSTEGTSQDDYYGGIEYDSKGREKSFKFLSDNGSGGFKEVSIPKYSRNGKRQYIIHGFRPEYAGQRQGFALYSHLLQEMEDITTLKMSHLQKAINQSSFGFYTKPSLDAPASGGPDDFANEAVGVISDFLGADAVDAALEEGQDALNAMTMNIVDEQTLRQPGSMWYTGAAAGEQMEAVKQTAPVDGFAEFVDSLVSYLTSSSGMPIEVLKMKFGQNYSASRATLVMFWRVVNLWRSELKADYLDVISEMWLSEEIAAGRVKAPGWSDPRLKKSWCNVRWVGSSVPDIDPKKSAEASALRSTLGHESLDDGALRYNGSDGATNRAKLREEIPGLEIGPWNKNYEKKSDTTN